jgi:hypothetical protein
MAVEIQLFERLLANQGYNVTIKEGQQLGQVAVVENGILGCGDGRPDSDPGAATRPGPKLFGGLFGPASIIARGKNKKVVEPVDLMSAGQRIKNLGFEPSVHTDQDDHPCGYEGLLIRNELSGMPRLLSTREEVKDILEGLGGTRSTLLGRHEETKFVVNTVPMTTRTPDNTAFVVDAWVARPLGLDAGLVIETSGQAVTRLTQGKVRDVEIWK